MNQKCANYKVAIEKAQKVLADNFLFNPPIVAEEIAKNYGLKVGYYIFLPERRNVSGFISNGEIIINDEETPQRKNFTIAHELGHYLLGHVEDKDYGVLYRQPIAEQTNKPMEQEANCFAANLLVPEEMLKKYLTEYPFANNYQLANIFGVSPDVIGFRRQNLRI